MSSVEHNAPNNNAISKRIIYLADVNERMPDLYIAVSEMGHAFRSNSNANVHAYDQHW